MAAIQGLRKILLGSELALGQTRVATWVHVLYVQADSPNVERISASLPARLR